MTSKISTEQPLWMNADFIEKIMRASENDESINVKNITSNAATAIGDNYLSHIARITVEYTSEKQFGDNQTTAKKSLICKIAPEKDGYQTELVKKTGAFEREIQMMETTLVRMNELLKDENCRLSARILYSKIGNPSFILLEDLGALGFLMGNRQIGLDLLHAKLVMERLAKFHASSLSIYEKDPSSITRYNKGVFDNDYPQDFKEMFQNGMKNLSTEMVNWTELEPWYTKKILELSEVAFQKLVEVTKPKDGEFNVLNHGDCWLNNMLFRYNNEGEVVDHIFVDFQFSNWTNSAIDISYLMSISLMDNVLINHRQTLLDEYLKTLSETMFRLNCKTKPPSMKELQKSLRDREFLELVMAAIGLPFMFVDQNQSVSLDVIMEKDSDYVSPGFKLQIFRDIMVRRLRVWNSHGLFDD